MAYSAMTQLALQDNRWQINRVFTYTSAPAEGLLLNVRMVNATFEDLNRAELDPEEITQRFILRIPEYVACGVRAFSLNLQGGYPGYEGALNSAFASDGSLRAGYLKRVQQVIEACDRNGAVVILGCYYQLQSSILRDEESVRSGVFHTARWIVEQGFTNVLLEIANEFGQQGFAHSILREEEGILSLLHLARKTAPQLLVSASRQGELDISPQVCQESDFILVHFNRLPLEVYPAKIKALQAFNHPVVCTEDRKIGEEGCRAVEICVQQGCSWGFQTREVNLYHPPFRFEGAADDPQVYARFKELATPS